MNLPIRYRQGLDGLEGATWQELEAFGPACDPIRQVERASIRAFMEKHQAYLKGRVMDFGAGTQPYKDLVDGEYVPFEKDEPVPGGYFDAVMCNQVLQYVVDPFHALQWGIRAALRVGGVLLLTYPTNWDEVEETDLWRFTAHGMARLLENAGFTLMAFERRAEVVIGNFTFPLGYGVVAIK